MAYGKKKPMNGALKGKQKNLPTALKKKIIASKNKKMSKKKI